MSKRRANSSSNPKPSNPTSPAKKSRAEDQPNPKSPNPKPLNRQSPNPLRPNTKRTGERSEAAFLYQASQRRFAICKPWGDSERYDFILDNRPQPEVHLFRIQVKCTDALRADAYETRATYTVGKRRAVYTKRDIDFIAAHVVPLDIWYIVPVEICTPQPMLRFYPHRQAKKMRLEKYREAWQLLDPPLTIQACADEDYPEGYLP
ncbi:MAG: group I intron-associated PD-(D/E)XK endonuclease, partial [Candidatus Sulfotelmatobacter sp.]